MMKETNFVPLMLLLLLAVTPRNSCANPIASPGGMEGGAPAVIPSIKADDTMMMETIENDMKKGTDILTRAITWLKDNALNSFFDESILDLEKKINKLPKRLAVYRAEILDGLYTSQDRLSELRVLLVTAADTLKNHCTNLMNTYEGELSNLENIRYSAGKFVEYAEGVNCILQAALNKTIAINNELSATKAFLNDFKAVLDEETNNFEADQVAAKDIQHLKTNLNHQQQKHYTMTNDDDQYTDKVILLLCTFGLNSLNWQCTKFIVFTNIKMREATNDARNNVPRRQIDDQKTRQDGIKMLNSIKAAHKSATTLISNVDIVKTYLSEETALIINWQAHLNVAILENTNVSGLDIKYNIGGIKGSLQVLKDACVAYLNHGTPVIFQTRVSRVTSGS